MRHLHVSEYHSSTKGGSVTSAYNLDTALRELLGDEDYRFYSPYSSSARSRIFFYLRLVLLVVKSWICPFDSVLSHHPPTAFLTHFTRSKRKYYFCHGPWSSESRSHYSSQYLTSLKDAIQLFCLRSSTEVLFISEYMATLLRDHYPREHFASFSVIGPIPASSRSILLSAPDANTNTVSRATRFCICRRLTPRMGIEQFLQAYSSLNNPYPIDIIGSGPLLSSLSSNYNSSQITFHGAVSSMVLKRHLSSSTICFVPALELEGFGLIILEAIEHGAIPLVSSSAGGGAKFISSVYPQLIFHMDDPESLQAAITFALEHQSSLIDTLQIKIRQAYNSSLSILAGLYN